MKYLIPVIAVFIVFSCASAPKPNPPPPFTVDLKSPRQEIGEIDGYFEDILPFSKLKKNTIKVFYYPVNDAVCLQFKIMFINYNQFWSKAGRDAFISSFRLYQEDYEQRKLTNSNRKNKKAYGSVEGFFAWKITPVSVQAWSNPKIDIGYQFRDDAVFFTIAQPETTYIDPNSRDSNQTVQSIVIFFTRAQAEKLAEQFNLESLQTPGMSSADEGVTENIKEEYKEY